MLDSTDKIFKVITVNVFKEIKKKIKELKVWWQCYIIKMYLKKKNTTRKLNIMFYSADLLSTSMNPESEKFSRFELN